MKRPIGLSQNRSWTGIDGLFVDVQFFPNERQTFRNIVIQNIEAAFLYLNERDCGTPRDVIPKAFHSQDFFGSFHSDSHDIVRHG